MIFLNESFKGVFPKRLVALRKEKKLTQYKLAEELGFSRGLIANYEQGTRQPDYDTLKILADFFNVSTDYLIGRISNASHKITNAVSDDPELLDFTKKLLERESLQLLFKQTKDMDDKDINKVLKIIKAIEDEEDIQEGL